MSGQDAADLIYANAVEAANSTSVWRAQPYVFIADYDTLVTYGNRLFKLTANATAAQVPGASDVWALEVGGTRLDEPGGAASFESVQAIKNDVLAGFQPNYAVTIDPSLAENGLLERTNAVLNDDSYRALKDVPVNAANPFLNYDAIPYATETAANITRFANVVGIRANGTIVVLEGIPFYSQESALPVRKVYDLTGFARVSFMWSVFRNQYPAKFAFTSVLRPAENVQEYIGTRLSPIQNALASFLEGAQKTISEQQIPVAGWRLNIIGSNNQQYPQAFGQHIRDIDVTGYNRFSLTVRRINVINLEAVRDIPVVLGVRANGESVNLLPSVMSPLLQPLETYDVDITGFTKITVNAENGAYLTYLSKSLVEGDRDVYDIVKKAIDQAGGRGKYFNVHSYGATGNGLTDDRKAIQNAINACYNAGGGVVYFPYPDVFYNLGKDLTQPSEVVGRPADIHPRAQLIIPYNDDTTANICIELRGEYKANLTDEAIANVGRSIRGFIKSEYVNPGTDRTSILSTRAPTWNTWAGKNYVTLHIESLVFRAETVVNAQNVANRVSGIDMERIIQFTFNDLKVDTSSVFYDSVRPEGTFGIFMPSVSNKQWLGHGTALVVGFEDGIIIGEHFLGSRISIVGCYNALRLPDGESFHSASIQHFNAECCVNMIKYGSSQQVLNIFNYDVEHHLFEQKWFNFKHDLFSDIPNSRCAVNMFNAQVVKSNAGNVNEFIVGGTPVTHKILTGVGAN